jgi:hypothetical protein
MHRDLTLIGAAPAAGAAALARAMNAVPGPLVTAHAFADVALLAEPAHRPPARVLLHRPNPQLLQRLHGQQRRLELGAQAGAFLPFDPGAARCPAAVLPALLAGAATALAEALASGGRCHQWDVILRWPPEAALGGPRRAALAAADGPAALATAVAAALRAESEARATALRAALRPMVLAIAETAPVAGESECGATVLVPAGGEAAIEAALGSMPAAATAGAAADLRGPLPPISFAPLRMAHLEAGAVDAAWRLLDLPDRLDPADLTRAWRRLARDLHPDTAGPAADATRLDQATEAYRLLRGLAQQEPGGALERAALAARSGPRLALPIGVR